MFIIMVEALGRTLGKVIDSLWIKGLKVSSKNQSITHVWFVNYTMLSREANIKENKRLQNIFNSFG
jgi:hypothetical protein